MDSYKLREEHSKLVKEIEQLKHVKEVMDRRMKELHEEEMRYLGEIPILKDNSKIQESLLNILLKKVSDTEKALDVINNKYHELKKLSNLENEKLGNFIQLNEKEAVLLSRSKKEINDHLEDLRKREAAVNQRERKCDEREFSSISKDEELCKKEFQLKKEIDIHANEVSDFINTQELHEKNVAQHAQNVRKLSEASNYQAVKEELLEHNTNKLNSAIKNYTDLRSQVILQADKLSKELLACKVKQESLDRNILDLDNQSNALKIKELKIKKMAHDAGLIKELKELEASFK